MKNKAKTLEAPQIRQPAQSPSSLPFKWEMSANEALKVDYLANARSSQYDPHLERK